MKTVYTLIIISLSTISVVLLTLFFGWLVDRTSDKGYFDTIR